MYATPTAPRILPTSFLPAERRTPLEIARQVEQFDSDGTLRPVLDSMSSLVAVLNAERQILFGNAALVKLAESLNLVQFKGLRLGELLYCRRAMEARFGCGTSEACRTCGSAQAMQCAQHGQRTTKECRIATSEGDAYDMRITANPFPWQGQQYLLIVLGDITNEKRRQVLERIFFHDVLNTAGAVSGIASLIAEEPEMSYQLKDDLLASAEALVSEIKSQQLLLAAERGDLHAQSDPVKAGVALEAVQQLYRHHPVREGRRVELDLGGTEFTLNTDPVILQRVLSNMLKNALEATRPGEIVWMGAETSGETCTFWCNNSGEIPRATALQIFQRNFSTKGPGRGLGTYSIKLLGERFLGGRVGFSTSAEEGTRFFITLPLNPEKR